MGVEFNRIWNLIYMALKKCDQFLDSMTLILYLSSINVSHLIKEDFLNLKCLYLQLFVTRRPIRTLRMISSNHCLPVTTSGPDPCQTSLTWSLSSLGCP